MKRIKNFTLAIMIIACLCGCSKKRLFDLTIVSSRNIPVSAGVSLKQINERVEGKSDRDDFDLESAVENALNTYPGSVALSDVVVYKYGNRLLLEAYPLYIDDGKAIPQKSYNKKESEFTNTIIQLGTNIISVNGNYYNILSDSTVEIVRIPQEILNQMQRNFQKIERINIPEQIEYNGILYKVIGIEASAFNNFRDLKTINLPSTITYIGAEAFKGCSKLVSITIPEGVEKVESGTFSNCTKLSSVTLPSTLKIIGSKAFSSCWNLKTLNIPSNTSVSDDAFKGTQIKL
ncbi:MAG: leucine-rich repeat domain-containing protein [Bacteroidales bacterium]|nr:leucine-rich repeat domain-containing protein [Bacteroidales bacterium]MEE1021182.1 leucine-rich repeat domain-containing protein [Bacteroidales bacterium]